MIQPRPYQTEALKSILENWKDGVTRQLVSLPTGTGKTILFGMVVEALRVPTLIIAHREELLYQAEQKIRLIYPDAQTGILKAEERGGLDAEICIASVQTATRHTKELARRNFKLFICDEAHHATSSSYVKIFKDLSFMAGEADKLLLGVTATAFRSDKTGLDAVFEKIVFERSILTMIRAGYLADVRGLEVKTGFDISRVAVITGDFSANGLAAVIDTPVRNRLIVDTYLERGEGRHGVAFCCNVDHALHLASNFRERGVACEAVYGDMPKDERRNILDKFANHELQIITNCEVLTEGWDAPDLDLIIMARPTKSKGLFTQCVGRGLRLAPEKRDCLLIDFSDTAKNHNLCNIGTLAGKHIKHTGDKTLTEFLEAEPRDSGVFLPAELGETEINSLDLFDRSNFVWHKQGRDYKLRLMNANYLWCHSVEGGYSPLFVSSSGDTKRLSDGVLPVDYAIGICEDYARGLNYASYSQKNAPWRGERPSEAQINYLSKFHIPFDGNITKGEASELIAQHQAQEKPTERQIWFIRQNELHKRPEDLTKYEASQIISKFKQSA